MDIKIGNMFESNAKTLVNTVNCVGVMGKGVALEFKKRYPNMFHEYEYLCSAGLVKPGKPYFYQDIEGNSVLQFPTKDHWRSPSKLQYIIDGLEWFRLHYAENNVSSIAFPPLGCGNGGLSWDVVGPIMYDKLHDLPIDITIFAPYGTSPEKLSLHFLERPTGSLDGKLTGAHSSRINHYWYLILYIVQELNHDQYSLSVGRVIFQKICYTLTRTGIPTGFQFVKGSYGPFSKDVTIAQGTLANANLINEKQLGQKMIEIQVSPNFRFNPDQFRKEELDVTSSVIDLLSRVKNTEQAEMLSTVMFAFDSLAAKGTIPTEMDIVDYVEDWKPHWKASKHEEIISTMKDLSELRWIKPDYTRNFIPADDCC